MATQFKKKLKKVLFSLMPELPPPLNDPAIKRTFFCGFPKALVLLRKRKHLYIFRQIGNRKI